MRCPGKIILPVVLILFSSLFSLAQESVFSPLLPEDLQIKLPRITYTQRLTNRYISKGLTTSPRARTVATLNINWYGAYFSVISYWDLEGYAKAPDGHRYSQEPVEWDYVAGYSYRFGGDWPLIKYLQVGGDYCKTQIPYNRDGNVERYAFIVAMGCFLRPRLSTQWYPNVNDRVRMVLTLYYDYPIIDKLTLNNRLAIWMGNSRFMGTAVPGGVDKAREYRRDGEPLGDCYKSGIYSLFYTIELSYDFNERITFGPMLQFGWAPDHDIREAWEERAASNSFNAAVGCFLRMRF